MRKRAKWIGLFVLFLFVAVPLYYNFYIANIDRVQHSVDHHDNLNNREHKFYHHELRYSDLAGVVREHVTEAEFGNWQTMQDVKASFADVPRPSPGEADAAFQSTGNELTYMSYEFTLTGMKVRYLDIR